MKLHKLGPFQIDHPFVLAPMAGITNSPFRRLIRRAGSSVVISELVSANGIEYGGQKTLELLKFHEEERTGGLQIFGEDTDNLVKACQFVERLGADFVDLNMGCPVPKVVGKGAGSAMCKNPAQLAVTLKRMVESVKIPVTIKIRTGWDAQSRNALEIVQVAADAGVRWVAIHGRTRAQGYSGEADWEFIGNIKAKSPLPIIGNGDIITPELAVERLKTYGVDAVMIGRGALKNPFIFDQAARLWKGEGYNKPTVPEYLRLLDQQRVLLEESFNPRGALLHSRKFLAWYSAGFPGSSAFRKAVFSIEDTDDLWKTAREFFERNTQIRDLSDLSQPFLMGGHG